MCTPFFIPETLMTAIKMFNCTIPFQYHFKVQHGASFSPKVELILHGIRNFVSSSTNATTTYSGFFARHLPSNESYDAVVVGGGHNGLVAAAYLAKSGVK